MKSFAIKRFMVAAAVGDPPGEINLIRLAMMANEGEYAVQLSILAHHLFLIWLPPAPPVTNHTPEGETG